MFRRIKPVLLAALLTAAPITAEDARADDSC
jgi:hypothetical protein